MENRKYELTDITMTYKGRTLYRIRALKDFSDVKKGDLGGWVSNEYNLSQYSNCWIYNEAKCLDDSRIYDNGIMYDNSIMFDNSEMHGDCIMYDVLALGLVSFAKSALLENRITEIEFNQILKKYCE